MLFLEFFLFIVSERCTPSRPFRHQHSLEIGHHQFHVLFSSFIFLIAQWHRSSNPPPANYIANAETARRLTKGRIRSKLNRWATYSGMEPSSLQGSDLSTRTVNLRVSLLRHPLILVSAPSSHLFLGSLCHGSL